MQRLQDIILFALYWANETPERWEKIKVASYVAFGALFGIVALPLILKALMWLICAPIGHIAATMCIAIAFVWTLTDDDAARWQRWKRFNDTVNKIDERKKTR